MCVQNIQKTLHPMSEEWKPPGQGVWCWGRLSGVESKLENRMQLFQGQKHSDPMLTPGLLSNQLNGKDRLIPPLNNVAVSLLPFYRSGHWNLEKWRASLDGLWIESILQSPWPFNWPRRMRAALHTSLGQPGTWSHPYCPPCRVLLLHVQKKPATCDLATRKDPSLLASLFQAR